jgi:hypothetical protein
MDMCPEKERYRREYLGLLNTFEMKKDAQGNVDHRYLIKEYSRSSADQDLPLPNELRPPKSLIYTINYLVNDVIAQIESTNTNDSTWITEWYDFIWNRTRAIRKDITQQRLNDASSIRIHEICARFHIYCSHKLCEQPSNVFDFKINDENLKNCFQSLIEYYDEARDEVHENEPEFRAYMILHNLNDGNILCKIQRLKRHVQDSFVVKYALRIYFAYNSKNYVKFFRLVANPQFGFLFACLTHRYFVHARIDAIRIILSAYRQDNKKMFDLNKLVDLLCFDDESDALFFIEELSLDVIKDDNSNEKLISFSKTLNTDRSTVERLRQRRSYHLAEEKLETSRLDINQVIYGDVNFGQTRDILNVHSSFDASGSLVTNDFQSVFEETKFPDVAKQPGFSTRDKPIVVASSSDSNSSRFFQTKPMSNLFTQHQPQKHAELAAPKVNFFSEFLQKNTIPPVEQPPVDKAIKSKIDELLSEEIYQSITNEIFGQLFSVHLTNLKSNSSYAFEYIMQDLLKFELNMVARTVLKEYFQANFFELILNECIVNSIYNIASVEIDLNQADIFLNDYANVIYGDIYLDLFSNELNIILNEIKDEYERDRVEEIAQNLYFDNMFDSHLYEILHKIIYEDTQLILSCNHDLYKVGENLYEYLIRVF